MNTLLRASFMIAAVSLMFLSSRGLSAPADLDATFGGTGKVSIAGGSNGAYVGKGALALQPDGRILIGGHIGTSNADFAVARCNTDGTPDFGFGSGGKVTTAIGTGNDYGHSLALQSDGKIVLAGSTYNGANFDFAVVRYNSNGTLDNTFGTGGKVITVIGGSEEAKGVAIQPDGRIVVAGYASPDGDVDFALVRYHANGSLDNTFGLGGKVTTRIPTSFENGSSIALQNDGKILVAGTKSMSAAEFAVKVLEVSPAANVICESTNCRKSIPATALPSAVESFTIAGSPDGAESVRLNRSALLPESPSMSDAPVTESSGGASSFRIVPVAVLRGSTTPGPDRVMESDSSASNVVSPMRPTWIVFVTSPGSKVIVGFSGAE